MVKVLISGAGTGGLALAQGLQRRGHEVVVVERGRPPVGPRGYRMALHPQALETLQQLLPAPVWDALLASGNSLGEVATQRVFDPQLRLFREVPLGDDKGLLLIGPGPMRRLLAHGLDDVVRWRTQSESYAVDNHGVTLTTSDGAAVRGDLLVIAEGVHSRLRRQLLGGKGHTHTGTVAIGGRAEGRAADLGLDTLGPALDGAPVLVSGAHAYGMFISPHDPTQTKVDPDAIQPGLVDHEDPYIAWSVTGPETEYPPAGTPESMLRAFLDRQLAGWHPDLLALVDRPSQPALERYVFYAGTGVPVWPTSRVTILGDAIHAVPPSGAIGGTTAIRDAGHLVAAIHRSSDSRADLLQHIHGYEQLLRSYADDVVAGAVEPLHQQARIANRVVHKAATATLSLLTNTKNALGPS